MLLEEKTKGTALKRAKINLEQILNEIKCCRNRVYNNLIICCAQPSKIWRTNEKKNV